MEAGDKPGKIAPNQGAWQFACGPGTAIGTHTVVLSNSDKNTPQTHACVHLCQGLPGVGCAEGPFGYSLSIAGAARLRWRLRSPALQGTRKSIAYSRKICAKNPIAPTPAAIKIAAKGVPPSNPQSGLSRTPGARVGSRLEPTCWRPQAPLAAISMADGVGRGLAWIKCQTSLFADRGWGSGRVRHRG